MRKDKRFGGVDMASALILENFLESTLVLITSVSSVVLLFPPNQASRTSHSS